MTSKTTQLTELEESLLAAIKAIGECENPADLTWADVVDEVSSPDFDDPGSRYFSPWHHFVPPELRRIWHLLQMEAKATAYLLGAATAQRFAGKSALGTVAKSHSQGCNNGKKIL